MGIVSFRPDDAEGSDSHTMTAHQGEFNRVARLTIRFT
jgi:hypothetical protein